MIKARGVTFGFLKHLLKHQIILSLKYSKIGCVYVVIGCVWLIHTVQ
jgi:hypothetical protein